ncbi:hypothetical protein OO013_04790 [Mangrovivirga sp. M17]|uniref:Uncharacterized protein n=1 Tax=Mangrovivirga halotolerans TaxID=2993936 RepID=A0ABT3RMX3_9BACT|nr:hypothetical protein [Mangrovivirga halotolerans]MCX2743168.1 hypothetical protein [Mangrovivirga halotolerans]
MIKILSRKETLEYNSTLASFIVKVQEDKYSPEKNQMLLEPGEHYDDQIGEYRSFNREECNRINEELLTEFNRKADKINVKSLPKKFTFKVYDFPAASMSDLVLQIGLTFQKISNQLNAGPVLFMNDFAVPWLSQKNDYAPVKEAQMYLKRIGVDDDFAGGFIVNTPELLDFMSYLFWIIRCNAELPPCYFTFQKSKFVASLCKYGNVHFTFYNEEEMKVLEKIFDHLDMKEVPGGACLERFADGASIEGRRIDW